MAYSVSWPLALPQIPLSNYSETIGVIVIRTQTDLGPAKQRRRAQRPDILSLTFNMSTTQCETLRAFVQDTLRGTMRFGFTHPRKLTVVEARIIPQGDGQMYTISYILPDFYQIALNMEILP
jgi:hypothetical protein